MHDALIAASERVEAVRRSEWGALGVWWFRFTLRRALRDVDTGARWDGRTQRGLARAVQQHERALARGRAVIRWLEESIAPTTERPSAQAPAAQPSAAVEWARGVLAVIGAGARASWIVARPALLVLGVIALMAGALFAEDADDVEPPDFHGVEWDAEAGLETPDPRHAADVVAGAWTVGVLGVLAAGGGALAWWLG